MPTAPASKLPLLFGLATDDSHNYHQLAVGKSNTGRGWVMVKAKSLSPANIISSMEKGDFYSKWNYHFRN